MGYYTYYSGNAWDKDGNEMDFVNPTNECSLIIKTLATLMQNEYSCDTIEELSDAITEIFDGGSGDLKWYDYETHMKELAKKFPECKFELEGFGEDRGDWWLHQFYGDKDSKVFCSPPEPNLF